MLGPAPRGRYRGIALDTSGVPAGIADQEQTTDDSTSSGTSYIAGSGQSVTFGAGPSGVSGVRLNLTGPGNPRAAIRVAVYAVDGGGLQTGAALAVSDWHHTIGMADAADDYYFVITGWTPSASTKYAFVRETKHYFGTGDHSIGTRVNSAGGYAGGAQVVNTLIAPSAVDAQNASCLELSNDLDFTVYSASGSDTADTTPPVLSSPTGAALGPTTGQGQVTTDEGNGTLYWVVTQSATQPSVVQIQAGQDHTGSAADASSSESVSASGVQTVNAGGLAASAGYYFHFQQEDTATNDSNRVSSTLFTTPAVSSSTSRSRSSRRGRSIF